MRVPVFDAAHSCVAFKKELILKIKTSQADLAELKSVRIVIDQISCLRAVRGNSEALLFESLVIDADPESATDWINFSRGWKRVAPDDILEQPDLD